MLQRTQAYFPAALLCACLTPAALPVIGSSPFVVERVMGSGDAPPGAVNAIRGILDVSLPMLDSSGAVLMMGKWFEGTPGSPGAALRTGLFYGTPGNLVPVMISGTAPPGAPNLDVVLSVFPEYFLSETGQVSIRTGYNPGPVGENYLVYTGTPTNLNLLAGSGLPAIGGVDGTTQWVGRPVINEPGQIAFGQIAVNDDGTEVNNVMIGSPDNLLTTFFNHGPVPGLPGVNFVLEAPTTVTINDLGWSGFKSFLEGPAVDGSNYIALFSGDAQEMHVVARSGDQAPNLPRGVTFADLGNYMAQNAAGDVLFGALLQGPGVVSANDFAIYAGPRDAPQFVSREGQLAPGLADVTVSTYRPYTVFNDAQSLLWGANLSGPGLTSENDGAFWFGAYDDPHLLVRDGDPAPGLPEGTHITFTEYPFSYPAFFGNDLGDLLMISQIVGAGVDSTNDYALWFRDDAIGIWNLLFRTGDLLDGKTIAPGVGAIATFLTGPGDGRSQSIVDNAFAVNIDFTDGSTAVYRVTVPEPSTLLFACSAAAGLFLSGRRRPIQRRG